MKRRFTMAVAALSLLAGASMPAYAQTLRWSAPGDAVSFDPNAQIDSFTQNIQLMVYDTLVRRNRKLEIEPALATSWEIVAPDRWRFKLRQGVKFHDGESFTADDVVASVTRTIDPGARNKGNLATVISGREGRRLHRRFRPQRARTRSSSTTSPASSSWTRSWLEANNALKPGKHPTGVTTYASTHANGTGPFKLESYQPDAGTVMIVNEDWWDKPEHNLKRIEFRPIKSDATRVAALLSGEIDMMAPRCPCRISAASLRDARLQGGRGAVAAPHLPRLQLAARAARRAGPEEPAARRQGAPGALARDRPRHDPEARHARQVAHRRHPGRPARAGLSRPSSTSPSPTIRRRRRSSWPKPAIPNGFKIGPRLPERPLHRRRADCASRSPPCGRASASRSTSRRRARATYFPKVGPRRDRHLHARLGDPAADGLLQRSLGHPRLAQGRLRRQQPERPGQCPNSTSSPASAAVELDEGKRRAMLDGGA